MAGVGGGHLFGRNGRGCQRGGTGRKGKRRQRRGGTYIVLVLLDWTRLRSGCTSTNEMLRFREFLAVVVVVICVVVSVAGVHVGVDEGRC